MKQSLVLTALALLPLAACSGDEDPMSSTPVEKPADSTVGTPAKSAQPGAAVQDKVQETVEGAQEKLDDVTQQAQGVVQQAETLVSEVQAFLQAGNVEKAQLGVNKLDALRDQLPNSWAAKIDQLQGTIDTLLAAKKTQLPAGLDGVKLPGGG